MVCYVMSFTSFVIWFDCLRIYVCGLSNSFLLSFVAILTINFFKYIVLLQSNIFISLLLGSCFSHIILTYLYVRSI